MRGLSHPSPKKRGWLGAVGLQGAVTERGAVVEGRWSAWGPSLLILSHPSPKRRGWLGAAGLQGAVTERGAVIEGRWSAWGPSLLIEGRWPAWGPSLLSDRWHCVGAGLWLCKGRVVTLQGEPWLLCGRMYARWGGAAIVILGGAWSAGGTLLRLRWGP